MIDDGHTCEQALHLVQLAATVNVKSGVEIMLFLDKGKKWNLFCECRLFNLRDEAFKLLRLRERT